MDAISCNELPSVGGDEAFLLLLFPPDDFKSSNMEVILLYIISTCLYVKFASGINNLYAFSIL